MAHPSFRFALPLFLGIASGLSASAQTPVQPPAPAPTQTTPPAAALHALDASLLDTSVNPCTDFYQYACGGWLKAHPIPEDRASFGRDTEVEDGNVQVLRQILEKAAAGGTERSPDEQKIGDAYASCMDTNAINARGMSPLKNELQAIDRIKSKRQLPELLASLHNHGTGGLFFFHAEQDYRDATSEIAAVTQPRLGLPEKGYYDRTDPHSAELRTEYTAHLERTFTLLGEPQAKATTDANTVLRLETALAAASLSRLEMRNPENLYHRTPLVQFAANSPELGFDTFLKRVGAPDVQVLNVAEPEYFLSLSALINSTSLDDLKTFLRWAVVRAIPGTALPQPLDEEAFSFYGKVLYGQPEQEPRWKRCTDVVDRQLGEALGQLFVAQRFSPADKQRTQQLTNSIEDAAADDIKKLAWLSDDTKTAANEKLRMVANNIGYPNKWRDYSTLTVKRDDAFGNAQRARAFEVIRDTQKIGKPVDRSDWEMTPPTVNAYYSPQLNSINFPAGILQPPYYDPSQDDAVNYGSIGGTIGHELTHGFDDEGRQFDGHGNLRDWWDKDDAQEFTDKASCVEKEYDNFVAVDDLHVNGKLTLGENLADLAGLRLAWLAYNADADKQHTNITAPGGAAYGDLSPEQQFFVAYGQSWCEATRDAHMRERVEIDPHAPEKFRVNGVVRNMPSFAAAFHCQVGEPMAPESRCTLW